MPPRSLLAGGRLHGSDPDYGHAEEVFQALNHILPGKLGWQFFLPQMCLLWL